MLSSFIQVFITVRHKESNASETEDTQFLEAAIVEENITHIITIFKYKKSACIPSLYKDFVVVICKCEERNFLPVESNFTFSGMSLVLSFFSLFCSSVKKADQAS